jgi:hypothetical protein
LRFSGAYAEERDVTKSIYAVAGLGLGSCLLLSLMMQHLLELRTEREKSPLALEIQDQFGGRLVGPVDVVITEGERRRIDVRLRILAGLDKRRFGRTVGEQVWRSVLGTRHEPSEIVVLVGDEDDGPIESVAVSKPELARRGNAAPGAPQPARPGSQTPGPTPQAPATPRPGK